MLWLWDSKRAFCNGKMLVFNLRSEELTAFSENHVPWSVPPVAVSVMTFVGVAPALSCIPVDPSIAISPVGNLMPDLTESSSPKRTKLRKDKEDPKLAKSSKDTADPRRAKLRKDKVDPKSATSMTDNDDPRRAIPNNEKEDPNRAQLLKESDAPR
jgi:hypothetical protein